MNAGLGGTFYPVSSNMISEEIKVSENNNLGLHFNVLTLSVCHNGFNKVVIKNNQTSSYAIKQIYLVGSRL